MGLEFFGWISDSPGFALQKKLAIMSAHDSILTAHIKQTHDANQQQQVAPFMKGELVYLYSKNISFAKGLTHKLIPKFIGPYQILDDFGNSSFRIELPTHLKGWGVHNVFHVFLLQEHIPNNDCLFPGQLDTRLGNTPEAEGEWAVNHILSHAQSGTNSVFEILWKSGDTTWLPYYQITHLQALTEYLDLLGLKTASKLPKGAGKPPQDNPQIFVGAIATLTPAKPIPATTTNCQYIKSQTHTVYRTQLPHPWHNPVQFLFTALPNWPKPDLSYSMPASRQPILQGTNHPRICPTTYTMQDPDYSICTTIHVGQLAEYLQFDEELVVIPIASSPFPSVSPSSETSGTQEFPLVMIAASAQFSWTHILIITLLTHPTTQSNTGTSTSHQPR